MNNRAYYGWVLGLLVVVLAYAWSIRYYGIFWLVGVLGLFGLVGFLCDRFGFMSQSSLPGGSRVHWPESVKSGSPRNQTVIGRG